MLDLATITSMDEENPVDNETYLGKETPLNDLSIILFFSLNVIFFLELYNFWDLITRINSNKKHISGLRMKSPPIGIQKWVAPDTGIFTYVTQ